MKNVWQVIQKVFAAIGAVVVFAFIILATLGRRRDRPAVDLRDIGSATADAAGHAADATAAVDSASAGVTDVQDQLDGSADRVEELREGNRVAGSIIDDIIRAGPVRRDEGDAVANRDDSGG